MEKKNLDKNGKPKLLRICVDFRKLNEVTENEAYGLPNLVENSSNDMHREIKERISNENRCYFSINKLLRSKLLSRKSKTTSLLHKLS